MFIRNSDGTGKTKVSSGLSNSKALDFNWSTDNTRLAFNEGPVGRRSIADKLYVNSVNGNSLLQVNSTMTNRITAFSYIK
ncbi:hypothetical protein MNBD_GAMMA25-1539 [hydrothermal vent metagenome]|uniref:TolB protein, periplasmic protein involved in the tonb-independent uptake of group A colicins n=1 Tax=hydrothermal vent metagenome TaxID=652676 RepID=A0A3B1BL37_9ZZZZ